MKRTLIGAAMLTCLASPASAVLHLWQGDMFITAVNDAALCASNRVNVGDFYRSVFRAKGLGTNGTFDLLSLVFTRGALQVVPTAPAGGALDAATNATVRYIYGSAGYQQLVGVAISPASVVPPAPLTTDPTVTVTLTIANLFSNPAGCNATFTGTLAKRP